MIIEMIQEWFKELLIDGIISNLSGTFDTVNTKVGEIAGEVGMTPAGWNGGIFNMIRGLSETVIVPIAGIILTFVMCYELIQLIVEKNNLHDFDTWLFWKWIFKTFCAVLIVTNTWNIVMAVFDMAQSVVNQSAGVIISDAGIDISGVVGNLETTLADWSIGSLLGLWFQSIFVGLCSHILTIAIFLVIYGRMIEVYLTVSVGPIPFATMVNREWGHTGQNYLKSLLALGFQAFLIMVCVGIYAVLVQNIAVGDDITVAIWECLGYTVLLCYTLFKTGSLAKSRGVGGRPGAAGRAGGGGGGAGAPPPGGGGGAHAAGGLGVMDAWLTSRPGCLISRRKSEGCSPAWATDGPTRICGDGTQGGGDVKRSSSPTWRGTTKRRGGGGRMPHGDVR